MSGALTSTLGGQAPDSAPPPRRGILPVGGYAEATGLQLGVTAFRFYRSGPTRLTRPSSSAMYLARTAKEHTKAFVQAERWSADNRAYWRARAEYLSYPLPFFGVGPHPERDEEWYGAGVTTLHGFYQGAYREGDYILVGVRHVRSTLRQWEPNRQLASVAGTGAGRSSVSQLQGGIVRDTRDVLGAPRTGVYQRAIFSAPVPGSYGANQFVRSTFDYRWYAATAAGHVWARQIQYDAVLGDRAPFDQLPMLGADTAMRGYARGRYRAPHVLTGQVEFRSAFWRRVGFVTFAGVGTAAPSARGLIQTWPWDWYPSAGIGLRYLVSPRERSTARLDFGVGRGSIAINIGFNEAF